MFFKKKNKITDSNEIYIIAGLGNPGRQYVFSRHNCGFTCIDYLANKYGINVSKKKFSGLYGDGYIGEKRVILIKPQTFMNLSGECIRNIVDWYKIDSNHLLVIYDDIDIPLGTVKLRMKGSAGTHNGMRNIISNLSGVFGANGEEFARIRIGIGKPEGRIDLKDYVLQSFDEEQLPVYKKAIIKSADTVSDILDIGVEKAMNKCNTVVKD